jgi:HTH-type transcriptional regulator/antitoxin HigA
MRRDRYATLDAGHDYMNLIHAMPLKPIYTDAELDAAIATIDSLLDQPELSAGEQAYLDVLSLLVESYEHDHVDVPPVTGTALVRHLMDANGLTQQDMAPLFGTQSIVSEVLSGKRPLAKSHVQRLSAYFGLPADAFLG